MVIKDTLLHSGWSYGNGDDQYDNESIGSTIDVFSLKKSIEIPKKNKKNENKKKMYSNKDRKEHTDEQGWTTIEANSNRKAKSEISNHSSIDSIIATINVDINQFSKGAPEAKIDSPTRENRCIISDETRTPRAIEFELKYQSKQKSISPMAEETGEETADQIFNYETDKIESYVQSSKRVSFRGDRRSNKPYENERMETTKGYKGNDETAATSTIEGTKEIGFTTTATKGSPEVNQIEKSNGVVNESNNGDQMNDDDNQEQEQNTNNDNINNNGSNGKESNNENGGGKQKVSIVLPTEMNTYAFTVSWRPDQKKGKDGKIIIKNLMREMVHRTPSITFHPTNSATSPVPRDINNINNDFPKTPASFDDFFDQMRNRDHTNQRTFMKVTMPHDDKELQKKLSNYLFHNKLYMNSPFIDDNTLEHVGFIEKGHSRMVHRPNLEMKIRNGLKEVMNGEMLTPQQAAQLKHLTSPIRVECHRGTVRAGPNHQQVVCEGIILKTAKSQAKIVMELLSMLPETLLGEHYRIMPKSLGSLLGYELYGQILAETVTFQNKLRPITIMHCHPSIFEDMYDSVKVQNSKHIPVNKFITECCGAISIEETSETKAKGKYIVVVPEEKVESARIAIGKMFQEFQQNDGRPTALACLTAYQNYPLVNDNVTISGHAQRLSERIRERYRNKPKPQYNHSSNMSQSYSYHGSTVAMQEHSQAHTPAPAVPRSIIKAGKHNNNIPIQQWPQSPLAQQQQQQQQQQTTTSTVMSNLSPDDSAKTMMTNVSRMVETLGSAVNTLARESANTNDTMKSMMMQQTATMNNLMMIMARSEERRQEIPSIIQQSSTPSSTITNSQYSLSQQSSVNKRKHGSNEDETTAASTVETNIDNMEEEEVAVRMEEEHPEEQQQDVMMEDEEQNEAKQQEATSNTKETALAAGDFDTQFPKMNDKASNAPGQGVNRQ
jgi:hypothetical protein